VRLRADALRLAALAHGRLASVVLLCLLFVAAADVRAQSSTATPSDQPTAEQIARAIEKVKADPNLATERTIKTLRWKGTDTAANAAGMPRWVLWIVGFFRWVAQTTRVLVWSVVIILMALLVPFVVRLTRAYGTTSRDAAFVAPTHVQSLDIRPETLPANIGAAARALWDSGEQRAALALLYRGLLSRLVHVHSVPIRTSSTEGDCLALVSRHLAAARQTYVTHLVRVWQRAVYGHHEIESGTVYPLCDGFAAALDAADSLSASAQGGAV
jgi:uncharacterized protein DUF4129